MRHWWQLTEAWQNKLASLKTLPTKWPSDRQIQFWPDTSTNGQNLFSLLKSNSVLACTGRVDPSNSIYYIYIYISIYQMNCYLPRYRTTTINASLTVFVCRNTFFRSRCSCLPHSLTFCHTRGKALFSIVLPIHTPCSASNELWNTFFKGAHSCWFLISCKQ